VSEKEIKIFYPESQTAWREWLEENHLSEQSAWIVFYKKQSGKKTISWSDAVDVALCYGWIDSKKIKIDHETSHQFFSKRKPKSTWSKINKDKIVQLTANGLMTEAGLRCIEIAKQNGSWTILDEVEQLIIPADLASELQKTANAMACFESLSKSAKKLMLSNLVFAKTPETRQKRITQIIASVLQNTKHLQ